MGVPAFFKWLLRRYSQNTLLINAIEEERRYNSSMKPVPIDITQRNPCGIEFDNFYIDMNGIIHPCCHPEEGLTPSSEEEMIANVLALVERLVCMVRPRSVLYLAIDGVAPRAKMNQQRGRRYLSGKERAFSAVVEDKIMQEQLAKGEAPAQRKPVWDSNQITPGTGFMEKVAIALQRFVEKKISEDEGWQQFKVILSDSNTPGEGEHKVMDFIRLQRTQEGYNANTRHVICGLDADLIMLGLATHEPHFFILREEMTLFKNKTVEQRVRDRKESSENTVRSDYTFMTKPYQFFRLSVLREFLQVELGHLVHKMRTFAYDFERIVDDFVFLCFLVGNDFIPNLPSISVHEGSIGILLEIYKDLLPNLGGYLSDTGKLNLERVQYILSAVAENEQNVFKTRKSREDYFNRKERLERERNEKMASHSHVEESSVVATDTANTSAADDIRNSFKKRKQRQEASPPEAEEEKAEAGATSDPKVADIEEEGSLSSSKRRRLETGVETERVQVSDSPGRETNKKGRNEEELNFVERYVVALPNVGIMPKAELWRDGYKTRWYRVKFMKRNPDHHFIQNVVKSYLEGLIWVLVYYYRGCGSWDWYYPYHYAPLASDFQNIASLDLDIDRFFEKKDAPVKPFEQLVSVLPPESALCLPRPYSELMLSNKELEPYFPKEITVDVEGKRFAWQGLVLLPFIDKNVLKKVIAANKTEERISEEEKHRNSLRKPILFVGKRNLKADHNVFSAADKKADLLSPFLNGGLSGVVSPLSFRIGIDGKSSESKELYSVEYELPKFAKNHLWVSCLHPNVTLPPSFIPVDEYRRKAYNQANDGGSRNSFRTGGGSDRRYNDRNDRGVFRGRGRGGYGNGGGYNGRGRGRRY